MATASDGKERQGRAKKSARRASPKGGKGEAKKKADNGTGTSRRWSAEVMRKSDALDLEESVFTSRSPKRIALSLKHSAETSKRRKGTPLQSAMSMLNFYINRAGRNLSPGRKRLLERAKPELRKAFGREP